MSEYWLCEECVRPVPCGEEKVHEGKMLCAKCYMEATTNG